MIDRELERKMSDFGELGLPQYVPRENRVHIVDRMVSTIIGARRAGKSFRMFQAADEMIREGVLETQAHVCHVDFDNPILSRMKPADLQLIPHIFLKLNPQFDLKSPLLFALDEIHKIEGWEQFVVELSRNQAWKVMVTGSSSKLLRNDIATELRGKAISTAVFPLSFNEYLRFSAFRGRIEGTKGQAEAKRLFDSYLKWGGYPAVVQLPDYTKEAVLREYLDTMLLKDIIQRYDVGKPQQCIHLYRYLLSNIGKPHTLQSTFGYLKQNGFHTSRDTLREQFNWAEDSFLLFRVSLFSDSLKEQDRNYKKIYAIDWALANLNSYTWDGSLSRALENMVYLNLHRKWHRVHYYLTREKRKEVDFIAVDTLGNPEMAVQVCMDISDPETLGRELKAIVETAAYFGIRENFIITYSQEEEFEENGIRVKAIPAWKWMTSG